MWFPGRKRRIVVAASAGALETGGGRSPGPAARGSGDNPIRARAGDRLGRAVFADHLTTFLADEVANEGLVVALTWPWGEGKTSVLNMGRGGALRRAGTDGPVLQPVDVLRPGPVGPRFF